MLRRSTARVPFISLLRRATIDRFARTLVNIPPRCLTRRRKARAVIPFLASLALTASCAKTIYQTAGTVGPLRWQAIDAEQTQRNVDGGQQNALNFTLVLREIRGFGISFDHVAFEVYQPGYEVARGELTNRLELAAYCELYLPFSGVGFNDPFWKITLTGKDERGQPVSFTIELAVSTTQSQPAGIALAGASGGFFSPLTIEEWRRLRVVTGHVQNEIVEDLLSPHEKQIIPLGSGAIVFFDTRIPPVLHRRLRNVASSLRFDGVENNYILTLALDLSPYGGAPGTFRITHSTRDPKPGRCAREILVEPVILASVTARDAPSTSEVSAQLARHGFRIGPGWSELERQALASVLSRIPDHHLAWIEGIIFNRGQSHPKEPDTSGEYNADTHVITMFDKAFIPSISRVGDSGSAFTAFAIAHEFGHTFDLLPLRRTAERLRLAQSEFARAFGRYETPAGSGQYRYPPSEKGAWETLTRQLGAAEQAFRAARSASGSSWQSKPGFREIEVVDQDETSKPETEFLQAAVIDGPVRVTKYAEKNWGEYFAESFALYLLDPQLLDRLRPNIYLYFAKHFSR